LLVLVFLAGGCATTPDKAARTRQARSKRDLGERFLVAGKTSLALEQFLEALELDPDDHFLHYDLAHAYDLKGATDRAEYHLKEAIRLKPDFSMAHNYLGVLYARRGQTDLAIAAYNMALKNLVYVAPQSAHYNLGLAYLSKKEYEKAVEHFGEAIKLVPDFVAAHNEMGQAYEGLGKLKDAKRHYRKAIEFNPQYAVAQFNLGRMQYRTGEKDLAIRSFQEAIRLAPDSDYASEARTYLKRLK
jgi:Tfp pilus assembly protein PilF